MPWVEDDPHLGTSQLWVNRTLAVHDAMRKLAGVALLPATPGARWIPLLLALKEALCRRHELGLLLEIESCPVTPLPTRMPLRGIEAASVLLLLCASTCNASIGT